MRWTLRRAVVPALFLLVSASFAQTSRNEKAKFHALERSMFDASVKAINGDDSDWKRLLDREYVSINADGSTYSLDSGKPLDFTNLAKTHLTRIGTSDFKLRRFGKDIAVITGRSKYFSGDKVLVEVWHTQIWVNRNGEWKFAGWHGTLTPEFQRPAAQLPAGR